MAIKKDEYRYLPYVDEGYVPAKSISEFNKAQGPTYKVLDPIPYTPPFKIPRQTKRTPTNPVVTPRDTYRYTNRTIYRKTRGRRLV